MRLGSRMTHIPYTAAMTEAVRKIGKVEQVAAADWAYIAEQPPTLAAPVHAHP